MAETMQSVPLHATFIHSIEMHFSNIRIPVHGTDEFLEYHFLQSGLECVMDYALITASPVEAELLLVRGVGHKGSCSIFLYHF